MRLQNIDNGTSTITPNSKKAEITEVFELYFYRLRLFVKEEMILIFYGLQLRNLFFDTTTQFFVGNFSNQIVKLGIKKSLD